MNSFQLDDPFWLQRWQAHTVLLHLLRHESEDEHDQ